MTLFISDLRIVEWESLRGGKIAHQRPVSFDDLASLEGAEKVWWCSQTKINGDGSYGGVLPGSAAWAECFQYPTTRGRDCGWRIVIPVKEEE